MQVVIFNVLKLVNTKMDFFEQILIKIDSNAKSSATTPFSYFIQTKNLKIHYVRIQHFQQSTYRSAVQLLQANHGFYITVFEDLYKTSPKKTIDRLLYHTGVSIRIHGRATSIKKITKPEAVDFLKNNHSNLSLKTKYSFGLFLKDELVGLACFGQIINMRNGAKSVVLIRFCNKSGHRVVGGLTKLIKHFVKTYLIDEIMTYCDLEWSNGDNYSQLGFENKGKTEPNEFVIHLPTYERIFLKKFEKEVEPITVNIDDYLKIENLGSLKFVKYFNV